MAVKMSVAVRNARGDAISTAIGTAAVLKIRTGAPPTNIADADSGAVLATCSLPTAYFAAASGGTVVKAGTWQDGTADAAGTAGHFRLYASNGTTQHIQGTCTGGGDMTLDNYVLAAGQQFTVNTFSVVEGNA